MNLETMRYRDYEQGLPQTGSHILGQERDGNVIVYQAFNPGIAKFAVNNQQFGGTSYKFERMSWIKPNFLWMMFRCGWARKDNQQRVLAIELSKEHFLEILSEAVHSTFKLDLYGTKENWQDELKQSNVRLQWDPDHGPKGEKLERKAIQLGLKGKILNQFGKEWIVSIEDITEFVTEQGRKVDKGELDDVYVMKEEIIHIASADLRNRLLLDDH